MHNRFYISFAARAASTMKRRIDTIGRRSAARRSAYNNPESFWSLLKRGIVRTYHNVSKKYLPLYLAEFQFRHNNRKNADIFGAAIAGS
jgi:transposase-like protein